MKKTNTHFLKLFCLLLGTLFWSGTAFAQPANDLCAGATPIMPSAQGTGCAVSTFSFPFDTDGTTASGVPSVCSTSGLDNWYTWTATTTVLVWNDGDGGPGIGIFANCADAAAGIEIDCAGTFAGDDFQLSGWNIGDDLIFQVYDFDGSSAPISFCLEEFIPPPPPANDECANAIDLGAAEIGDCTGTTAGSTVSSSESLPGCTGTADDDVWFSFTATSIDQNITITNTGGSSDLVTEVFDGCGGMSLTCQDSPDSPVTLTGLTIGNTYVFRVYTFSNFATTRTSFTVCVGTPPPPPSNDECANAIDLGNAEMGLCTGVVAGTTLGATESLPGCTGTADDDIWFSFTATGTDQDITVTNTGGTGDIVTEVFDGCGGNSIICQDSPNSPINLTGLTIGNTYVFRIYSWTSLATSRTNFDICIGSPPPPPSNDDCASIIDLGTLTSPISGTTCGSTNNFDQDCLTNGAAQDIIWSILVPANNTLDIGQTANTYDSKVRIAFGDTCPGDMLIDCNDDPDVETVSWTNNTCSDQTVYFILSAFSTGCGTFTLAWDLTAPAPGPANDFCATPTVLTVESGLACGAQTLGTNVAANPSCETPNPSCDTLGNAQDVWYSATVPLSGAVNVQIGDAAGPTNWGISIFSGSCGALAEEVCTSGTFPTATITGRTPGEVLLIRVFEDGSNTNGEFNICAFSPNLVCDLAIDSENATDETCASAEDGTITIVTTTSFGPVTYTLTGPVSATNTTGIFTGLPQGDYNYTATDNGFPVTVGPCTEMGGTLTIAGDITAPVVVCPPNTVITCNDQIAAATSVDEFLAAGGTITDDCGIASVTSIDISTSDVCPATAEQTITRLYTITDDSGNAATCEQVITVSNSLTGPIITQVPLDQVVDCSVNAIPQLNFFQADGECGVNIVTTVTEMPSTGTLGCNGSTVRFMYTATDGCGRIATHIQTFTIANDGPEFVCPSDICVIECPADNEMIQAQFDDYAELATVLTSCVGNGVTITNSFNPNFFIQQNCSNPSIAVENAVAFQTVTFRATDACGRTSTCTALVVIKDNDGPVMNGNVPIGVDNCSTPNKQAAYDNWIELALSNLSAMDECSGTETSVNYAPFSPNTNCQGGLATTEVTFTSTDACGNATTIDASYRIIDNDAIPMATVSGSLMTEELEAVELVTVSVDGGSFSNMMMTSVDGDYGFDLEMNQNHAITPSRNDNHFNGITTYDLILMGQHLLEIQTLDSPYKLIAADINHSGSITGLDLIQLRRLILHIDETFSNNTSWRFVDANHTFSDLSNPFATTFPEAVSINNLSQSELHNFVAIKIGDLNGSANPTMLNAEGDTRDLNELVFQVEDQQLSANQTYTVDFKAKDFNDILGYQFTLAFDPSQLEMVDFEAGQLDLSTENFGDRFKEGVLTSSWTSVEGVNITDDATLFSITFKANTNISLSNAIRFNAELTTSEAYSQTESLLNLGLEFNTGSNVEAPGFALLQNRPNPFNSQTFIAFTLPEMTDATLTIYDVAGRIIKQYKGDFNKGYNEITVNRADLSGAGLLYYQLETSTEVATMKMIVQ